MVNCIEAIRKTYDQVDGVLQMSDDILLQEIFSLREKLKIAIDFIKFYNPSFDEKEFIHQVGSVEYAQWIEELTEGDKQ